MNEVSSESNNLCYRMAERKKYLFNNPIHSDIESGEIHSSRTISCIQVKTKLYVKKFALNREKNLLLLYGYYKGCRDWFYFIYTLEGDLITEVAVGFRCKIRLSTNSLNFSDNQILLPVSEHELLFSNDYHTKVKQVFDFSCFDCHRNGDLYINQLTTSKIAIYSSDFEFQRYFREFPLLRNITFQSLMIEGDEMVVLTKCHYFSRSSTYNTSNNSAICTLDKLCLVTEDVLQTLTFPNNFIETIVPTQCCLDGLGNVLIYITAQPSIYSHLVWLGDGSIKYCVLEDNRRNFYKLRGNSITDYSQLINVYRTTFVIKTID